MISENLKKLNITLPAPPDPVGAYVAYKKIGNLLYISGQLPIDSEGKIIKGKIGKELSLEDGQKASKFCVINILAQAKKAMHGDLDKIRDFYLNQGYVRFQILSHQVNLSNNNKDIYITISLEEGDVYMFDGHSQMTATHSIPALIGCESRISLTFRSGL